MNRMWKATAVAIAVGGVCGTTGCAGRPTLQERYAGKVDPCWPERYNYQARQVTLAPFAAQAENGKVIDQTLFNYHFEPGTEKLTAGGIEKLDYLARKRPTPDSKVYLQTARDTAYDPASPEKLASGRAELDVKRQASIQKYLTASLAGRPTVFDITVIDPADTGVRAEGPATAVRGLSNRYQSGLSGGAGGLSGAGGGAAQANPGGGSGSTGGTGSR